MDLLSNEVLIEAYLSAKQNHLRQDFIPLTETELKARDLNEVIERS